MWIAIVSGLAGVMAAGMAAVLFVRSRPGASHRSLAGLLALTACAILADGLGLLDAAHALFWREIAMAAELMQPVALLYTGLGFLNPEDGGKDSRAFWRARVVGIVGVLFAALTLMGQVFVWAGSEDGQRLLALSLWGQAAYVFVAVSMTLGLATLELVLRASREPVRHRLKLILIGLGGLAGYQIYAASQLLLFRVWQPEYLLASSAVATLSLALIISGMMRTRLQKILVNAYVSQQALFGSITFIVIGLYLLAVGAVGEWLRRTDQPWSEGLSVVAVAGALVGLIIAAFSKTVRSWLRHVVARNFYRSKYDYRAHWLQVTEAFERAANRDAIMDRLLDLLIKTFPTTSVLIWSFREADQRYCLVRSMTMESEPVPLELSHPVVRQLVKQDEPVLIEGDGKGKQVRAGSTDDPLVELSVALCFPIRTHGRLTAFVALGAPLHGGSYGTDDCDLLRGIAHHVGVLLSHARLAEERQASAELEALHRFSLFCLHDLKNLAARLSLVAQNAVQHGRDPAFQESAMRTVTDTANKMTVLMSKLSLTSVKPEPTSAPEAVDMAKLLEEIIAPMRMDETVRLCVTDGPVKPVMAVREHMHQLLLNVMLNAGQSLNGKGEIFVGLTQGDSSIVITVQDTGCGIAPAKLESLFRPSQSSRPGGLGIGLYQCKQIVEAHGGTIQIRSEEGKGTQVTIELPVAPIVDHETLHVNG
ncbi:MAG TPA: XrtA/PEP-CTERM system histidine kinase PrsK [Nitrospira sp.]|nr:XrtA/PEP-CTERM system histidine kinase PrsK [Nitrospira sp.]